MKIDYDKIKQELSIEKVLQEYGMLSDLKKSGNRLYGKCPLHQGNNPRAFNVSLDKNLWHCFTHCGGGSVIDLIMALEHTSAAEAGKMAYSLLGIENKDSKKSNSLNFRLSLDYEHNYLKKRNIDIETAKYFGIGYCKKGIMENRIAIPIHNIKDELIAYCGRAIDNSKPKYKFPKGFVKSKILYNLNRLKKPLEKIVIVEGFFDVFALYKAGIDSVALMGSSLSYYQKKQLDSLEKRLLLMLDGDDAGRKGMHKAINMLLDKRPLKAIYLPENTQPDSFKADYLQDLVQ